IFCISGRGLYVNNTDLSPVQSRCFVLLRIAESFKTVFLHSKAHTDNTVKQHTVNPLIAPDVNPFQPSVISTVSMLFISTDHCISVSGS
ncbi:unnamed protein product, partial [Staurois parvus]